MHSAKHIRWSGLLAMVGGVIWTAAWILNWFTEDGTRAVLGLSERGWSRVVTPTILLFMAGLVGLNAKHKQHSGKLLKLGLVITFVGLAGMLAGNMIEWWVGPLIYDYVQGEISPAEHLGWRILLLGWLVVVPIGFILLGVATMRAKVLPGWRRALPLIIGLMLTSGMLLAAFGIGEAGLVISFLSFGLGWIVLGYALWSDRSEQKVA